MKENIDLTENRMFRDRMDSSLHFVVKTWIHGRIPWNFPEAHLLSDAEEAAASGKIPLIYTGTREERRNAKNIAEENMGLLCDCCGAKINQIPWKRQIGLCRICEEHLNVHSEIRRRFPWTYPEENGRTRIEF